LYVQLKITEFLDICSVVSVVGSCLDEGGAGGMILLAIQQDCEYAYSGPDRSIQRHATQSLLMPASNGAVQKMYKCRGAVSYFIYFSS
jgi:hypothetical protein